MIQIGAYGNLSSAMFPVLFSVGGFTVTTFGVFLALGFLAGVFLIWRLCRAWDLDEEKILDLTLLSFLGGLLGARLYFVIENLSYFISSPLDIILINKTTGFSFWGGFIGGSLTLYIWSKRFKTDFRQLADIALAGLLGGLIFSQLGCFFGACSVGISTKSFLGVNMTGFVGKRWPVQLFEALLFLFAYFKIWGYATHFHQRGKIAAIGFIYIGAIKLAVLPFKEAKSEFIFAILLVIIGFTVYYRIIRQTPFTTLKKSANDIFNLLNYSSARKQLVQKMGKYWYNQKTGFVWKLRNLKKLLRRSNVKFS